MLDVVRILEPAKESIMPSTSHCEMVLTMIPMSKCSDQYVSFILAEFVQENFPHIYSVNKKVAPKFFLIF